MQRHYRKRKLHTNITLGNTGKINFENEQSKFNNVLKKSTVIQGWLETK